MVDREDRSPKKIRGCWYFVGAFCIISILFLAAIYISLKNAKPYSATEYFEKPPETYEQYYSIAAAMAELWDPDSKLVNSGGIVSCVDPEFPFGRMTFEFGTSRFYFGLPRVSFARVEIDPQTSVASIVAEQTDITGHPATVEFSDIPLAQAIDIAEAVGGAEFADKYPECVIRFSLFDNAWFLLFDADPFGGPTKPSLRFGVDSRTGEVKEIPDQELRSFLETKR